MNSVIGQRCVIGAGSIIKNSYIFDDTIIGAGCVVESSIIGAGVTVKDETSVDRGCLLGDGVSVGPQAHLESFERLSKRRKLIDGSSTDGEDDSDIEEAENSMWLFIIMNELPRLKNMTRYRPCYIYLGLRFECHYMAETIGGR